MRIGIEAQRLFRPEKHGMDRAVLELIKQLQQLDTVNDYFIFVRSDQDRGVIQETANFTIVEMSGSYPVWEQIKLPKLAKQYQLDLLHCTSNTAPVCSSTPLITTIHDIIYLEGNLTDILKGKATTYQKAGNLYRRLVVPTVAKKSEALITVSHYEKQNMSAYFGTQQANKLHAIHNGVSQQFQIQQDLEKLQAVREKYKLPSQYLLHFGSMDPRKNTRRVLEAFVLYTKAVDPTTNLVLLSYSQEALIANLQILEAEDLLQQITLPGYIDDQDLAAIYQDAVLFLFPSLREGFGIPIIEAMACGVPVITSNTSSMPEVAGQAAHLVDPTKVSEIVKGMLEILGDNNYRNSLIERGNRRHLEFSWEAMAQQVLQMYKSILNPTKKNPL
ncbi:glycosyltransferase family 4 protein [Aureitalea marina]|uniref:Group 1 glycosyl transferase n=1 Tax=Aureitalea marina TaxID=930804 RepID=A0A2S7KR36_9FLAO|nr:glycosyltransferase family 1 protein [Aureitalea marina]PQB05085.1 hypothetical protein BST85_09405 [Aureitalea marina]